MRFWSALVIATAVAACAFEPGEFQENGPLGGAGGGGGGGGGTGGGGSGDPGPDAGPTLQPTRTCAFADPALRLCLDFEDSQFAPMVTDASPSRLDSGAAGVNGVVRGPTDIGASFALTSRIDVPESAALDIGGALTIEMWVAPGFAHSANLLQNTGQYRVQMDGQGRIGCSTNNAATWSVDEADPREWTHVACVFDGTLLAVYIDGVRSGQTTSTGAPTGGTNGTLIGSGFAGALDDIRVYARAWSATDVCAHAGRTTCTSNSGPGGGD